MSRDSDRDTSFAESFRICRVGGLQYAIPAAMVRATLFAHYGLSGDVPLHGERFPVLDPRSLFDLPPAEDDRCHALLLCRQGPVAALLVDEAQDRDVVIDRRRFQDLPWHFGGRERLWFDGIATAGDDILIQLHPEGLMVSYRSSVAVDGNPSGAESQP